MNPLIIAPIVDTVGKIIDRIIPDKTAAEKAKAEAALTLQSQEFALLLEQARANTEQAKSTIWFVAAARPAIMWICACSFAYATILEPVARFVAVVFFGYAGTFPAIDTETTTTILLGLLGLGALRTVEKVTNSESRR